MFRPDQSAVPNRQLEMGSGCGSPSITSDNVGHTMQNVMKVVRGVARETGLTTKACQNKVHCECIHQWPGTPACACRGLVTNQCAAWNAAPCLLFSRSAQNGHSNYQPLFINKVLQTVPEYLFIKHRMGPTPTAWRGSFDGTTSSSSSTTALAEWAATLSDAYGRTPARRRRVWRCPHVTIANNIFLTVAIRPQKSANADSRSANTC